MFSLSLCFLKVSWRHMGVGLSSAINRSSLSIHFAATAVPFNYFMDHAFYSLCV